MNLYKVFIFSSFLTVSSFSLLENSWSQKEHDNSNLSNSVRNVRQLSVESDAIQSTKNLENIRENIKDLEEEILEKRSDLLQNEEFKSIFLSKKEGNSQKLLLLAKQLLGRLGNISKWEAWKQKYEQVKKQAEITKEKYKSELSRLKKRSSEIEQKKNQSKSKSDIEQKTKTFQNINEKISKFERRKTNITLLIEGYCKTIELLTTLTQNNKNAKNRISENENIHQKHLNTAKNNETQVSFLIKEFNENIEELEKITKALKSEEDSEVQNLLNLKSFLT